MSKTPDRGGTMGKWTRSRMDGQSYALLGEDMTPVPVVYLYPPTGDRIGLFGPDCQESSDEIITAIEVRRARIDELMGELRRREALHTAAIAEARAEGKGEEFRIWSAAVNAECDCGGSGPDSPRTCSACNTYHRVMADRRARRAKEGRDDEGEARKGATERLIQRACPVCNRMIDISNPIRVLKGGPERTITQCALCCKTM